MTLLCEGLKEGCLPKLLQYLLGMWLVGGGIQVNELPSVSVGVAPICSAEGMDLPTSVSACGGQWGVLCNRRIFLHWC
jgi:hypothetical protein